MSVKSDLYNVLITGRYACYTRPEYRTERCSNVVGSAAAYEGLLSQVMGHRGARYDIEQVALLALPKWTSITSNEIKVIQNGGSPILTDDHRTLRTTTLLTNPKFIVSFRLRTASDADFSKFKSMLERRLRNKRYYRQPYLGIREYVTSKIKLLKDLREVPSIENWAGIVDYNASLGLCYYGTDWDDPSRSDYFVPLTIRQGVVKYPTWEEVRKDGICRKMPSC